jgi:hypothetical protein
LVVGKLVELARCWGPVAAAGLVVRSGLIGVMSGGQAADGCIQFVTLRIAVWRGVTVDKIVIHVDRPAELGAVASPMSLVLVGGEQARERTARHLAVQVADQPPGQVAGREAGREAVATATRQEPA